VSAGLIPGTAARRCRTLNTHYFIGGFFTSASFAFRRSRFFFKIAG
jgi:hypothetical protein